MNVPPEKAAALAAAIRADMAALDRKNSELAALSGDLAADKPDFRTLAAAAYLLHSVYTGLEHTFDQISRTFENNVNDLAQWHRELLDKMFLTIPGVRSAVLRTESRKVLNNLRGFRHVFRHNYDVELDPVRLRLLVEEWFREQTTVIDSVDQFARQLEARLTD